MRQHCVICTRWIVDSTALKRHIKYGHPTIWTVCEPKLRGTCEQVQSHIKRDATCPYCLRKAYSRHSFQCCVICQAALLQIHHDGDGLQQSGAGHDVWPPAAGPERTATTTTGQEAIGPKQPGGQQTAQTGAEGRRQTSACASPAAVRRVHGGDHSRIGIQHEDQINSAKQDVGFTLFFEQTGKMGILTALYQASKEWHALREAKPNQRHYSLRTTMLALMLVETEKRLQTLPGALLFFLTWPCTT